MSLLQVKQVSLSFHSNKFGIGNKQAKEVLKNISFSIEEGTCLGLIGTSGAGKSTLGKALLGIQPPQNGQVLFQGFDIYKADKRTREKLRRDLQVVFQDSYSAVNPRMTAESIISEPLENFEKLTLEEKEEKLLDF